MSTQFRFVRILFALLSIGSFAFQKTNAQQATYQESIQPLLKKFCIECHEGEQAEAEIDLVRFESVSQVRESTRLWQRVSKMLVSRQMPPKDAAQPTDSERQLLSDWVRNFLRKEAEAHSGDPGPVTLRRLNNAEYTYSIRDLTGIDSLNPAEEFPVDGAAGEGFNNTGDALGMSPALVSKYLDAAKQISQQAVLMPDGVRFFKETTRRDWTDTALARIRQFYFQFADDGGKFLDWEGKNASTPRNGRIPLHAYIDATMTRRDALRSGAISVEQVARQSELSPKYLNHLWSVFGGNDDHGFLLNELRAQWEKTTNVDSIVATIERWQQSLWQFNSIGHLGRKGAPKNWMTRKDPITDRQRVTLELPTAVNDKEIVIYLTAANISGNDAMVAWRKPTLQMPGRSPILLRDIAGATERLFQQRQRFLTELPNYLMAASQVDAGANRKDVLRTSKLNESIFNRFLAYLGIGSQQSIVVQGHFSEPIHDVGGHKFVAGWGSPNTPSIVANSSDQAVRIPGKSDPHSVVVHPSPSLYAAIGWQSPITGVVELDTDIADAHPECGNGVEWIVQHRGGNGLAEIERGDFGTGGSKSIHGARMSVATGDLVSIIIGPRSGQHACDLTSVNFAVREVDGEKRVWDLADQVSGRILDSNPLPDSEGNESVWHFYQGEVKEIGKATDPVIPVGSLLAKWKQTSDVQQRHQLAIETQRLAQGDSPRGDSPDAILYRQLQQVVEIDSLDAQDVAADERFGRHPDSIDVPNTDLFTAAPSTTEIRIPAALASEALLTVDVECESRSGSSAIQVSASLSPPQPTEVVPSQPILVSHDQTKRQSVARSLDQFRDLFPAALCYTKIVPVDEVVTLQLYYREDHHFKRLMCDDEQTDLLNRIWDELFFVAQEPLVSEVALEQSLQFATQDRPDLVVEFDELKAKYRDRADAFRRRLTQTEPVQVNSLVEFAGRAWRHKLSSLDLQRLQAAYSQFRDQKLTHDEAIRLLLARILVAPSFLYRLETPGQGQDATEVSDYELASRLSYFLWSTTPDRTLLKVAESGGLRSDEAIVAQTRRMLEDAKTRRMAIHFACQWLHLRDFDKTVEKNERLYPEFAQHRSDLYEETIRFFEDMFRNDGSILDLISSDHTFVNEPVARHYGFEGVTGSHWQRVEGIRSKGRGGILAMATVLASQSGASRTSPILRGNWVHETLLGERLPRPPPGIPQLPESVPEGKTARELIELHSGSPQCASCHEKIDPYGFALEQFDAIGRLRPSKVDSKTTLPDGQSIEGLDGLRDYLLEQRRDDIVHQFCKKLLGYALGRETQLSDEPLLERTQTRLRDHNYRFSIAVESIVTSPQFRQIRGRLAEADSVE